MTKTAGRIPFLLYVLTFFFFSKWAVSFANQVQYYVSSYSE